MSPNRHQFRYLHLEDEPLAFDDDGIYLDPLTSLAAYPSFERHMIEMIPELVGDGLHIAIGDVDGLREYVSERRANDPTHFGHLAGNACMRTIGRVTVGWAVDELSDSKFHICGTFGGDEVIIASSGISHELFAAKINKLCHTIRLTAPRPCSFALGSISNQVVSQDDAAKAYREFVSMIDQQLFNVKEHAHREGAHLDGTVSNLGEITLLNYARGVRPELEEHLD